MLNLGQHKEVHSMARKQLMKGVRLPRLLIAHIERVAKSEGSTFSQFLRTAAINELKRKKVA